MSIYKTRSQFFRSLAALNKKVAHGREIEGEVRHSFHRMNDETELTAACINWAHFPCVVHCGFSGRYSGGNKQLGKRKQTNELQFLSKVDDINSMDAIENAYDEAFDVMEQFISWMYNDFNTKNYCSNFDNIDLARFNFYPVQYGNLIGWSLVFEEEKYADSVTKFDETKWFEE